MSQTSREEFLRDLGYEEPFDESPVEVADGWNGGAVINTGGNIMCRSWRTWEAGERGRDIEYEVMYDVNQDANVALHAYTWRDDYDGYEIDEVVETREAAEQTDAAQAVVARQLMEEHSC
jgi:hypothetical protein